jgi:hypothetical protein
MWRKERADLLPRERKTANCFGAPEATHNRREPERRPMADEVRLHPERMTLSCQDTGLQQNRCHRVCKQRMPAHSKGTSVMKGSHRSNHYPRRAPHSQLNTTSSLVSRSPTRRSLQQSSVVSQSREIQSRLRNLQPIVSVVSSREAAACDHSLDSRYDVDWKSGLSVAPRPP